MLEPIVSLMVRTENALREAGRELDADMMCDNILITSESKMDEYIEEQMRDHCNMLLAECQSA
jgi:hypothetical protein